MRIRAAKTKELTMSDGMTSFELQQEVDRILNNADAMVDTPVEEPVIVSEANNSQHETFKFKPLKESSEKKPVKFKVRKVSHDIDKPDNEETEQRNKHVDLIQSQYDQCEARIEKIKKEISFLKNLLPPYNVDIDYHTRVKIDRAIEKLNMKNDELSKKKYDLGIALSRLWRGFDDSDIWVRSVSNS